MPLEFRIRPSHWIVGVVLPLQDVMGGAGDGPGELGGAGAQGRIHQVVHGVQEEL